MIIRIIEIIGIGTGIIKIIITKRITINNRPHIKLDPLNSKTEHILTPEKGKESNREIKTEPAINLQKTNLKNLSPKVKIEILKSLNLICQFLVTNLIKSLIKNKIN